MLSRIRIATKIPLFIVLSAFVSCTAAGAISILLAQQTFQHMAEEKLLSLASVRKTALTNYLESIREHIQATCDTPRTHRAFENLFTGESQVEEHTMFKRIAKSRGYHDIYLIDPSGNVFYSVLKAEDYATNVSHDEASGLGQAFRKAIGADAGKNDTFFIDYAPYAPHGGKYAGFIAAPIYIDDMKVGVIVAEMPTQHINTVINQYDGLGETGDIIVIGQDGLNRNVPRFHRDMSMDHIVSNVPVTRALAGEMGITRTIPSDGKERLTAYMPIEFLGVHWGLVAQQNLDELMAPVNTMEIQVIIASIFGLIGISVVGWLVARTITTPLEKINDTLIAISKNEPDTEILYANRGDEIGDIARSALIFKQNAEENRRHVSEQKDIETRARDERIESRKQLAERFEIRVQNIIQTVADAAGELYHTAESMGTAIGNMNRKASNVSEAADRASFNVQGVAAAVEEMSATVKEIAHQINKSSAAVKGAVEKVHKADETSQQLEKAARSIGEIVVFIQSIAKQINLLALNATIESARAGEAGKGFAVVAGEVKSLATQTSQATNDIANNIQSIQKVSTNVVNALRSVKSSINYVDEYSSAMASAVEEQSAATNEIAGNMGNAASGTTQISSDIGDVSKASGEASMSAQQVLGAAKILSKEADKLREEVKAFLNEIRQG